MFLEFFSPSNRMRHFKWFNWVCPMTSERSIQVIQQKLQLHGQDHILRFWSQLSYEQQARLLQQVEGLDLSQIDRWITQYIKIKVSTSIPNNFEPAPYYPINPSDKTIHLKYRQAKDLGKTLLANGKVAAFMVAGGQGTRLGFDGPKGNFPSTPIKKKSLFHIFAETIGISSRKYGVALPWYIMTSSLNYGQTIETFKSNQYFGLDGDQVFIFQQGTLPNFDLEGRILLANKDQIACSPDGHGGSLKALYTSGAVADMIRRGVEYISYWQVDNPMVNLFDPLFIGLHALDQSEMSSKGLKKVGPLEKLGNFCMTDGRISVIEYSDLPDDLAHQRKPDGSLVFELGSIGIHLISRSFIEQLNSDGFALPLHKAIKKIPFIDQTGQLVDPIEPNGIKLESFVFDAIPLAKRSLILETLRGEEFAPIKNAKGEDSAESSRELMIERAAQWLEAAGVTIPRNEKGSSDCIIEIAPSFALDREDVATKLDQVPAIRTKSEIYLA
jgi:UDP-N-acetylglucosamine/UDP-N-acetylgalactosamine diphosphorylase